MFPIEDFFLLDIYLEDIYSLHFIWNEFHSEILWLKTMNQFSQYINQTCDLYIAKYNVSSRYWMQAVLFIIIQCTRVALTHCHLFIVASSEILWMKKVFHFSLTTSIVRMNTNLCLCQKYLCTEIQGIRENYCCPFIFFLRGCSFALFFIFKILKCFTN